MSSICDLYLEDLDDMGYKKFGGICPNCSIQVSKHNRKTDSRIKLDTQEKKNEVTLKTKK